MRTMYVLIAATLLCSSMPIHAQTAAAPAEQTSAVPATQSSAAPAPAAKPVAAAPLPPQDWPNLHRYAAENAALPAPTAGENRVVFMGDSITDGWGHTSDKFFPGKPYINRGISGQTTPQMLVRFQQDVVHLRPAVVVILAGTNDIAGNTGPSTPQMIEDNIMSMTAIAQHAGIKVVLSSILPAYSYPWKPGIQPVPQIRLLNQWMNFFCVRTGCTYLDYYTALADDKGAMKPGLSKDGVHPTPEGYAIMAPLAEQAIAQALQSTSK